jgi:hypothetical protein
MVLLDFILLLFFFCILCVGVGLVRLGFEFKTLCLQTGTCKAGNALLEPYLQSIFLCLFWRWDLINYLPGLASNQ